MARLKHSRNGKIINLEKVLRSKIDAKNKIYYFKITRARLRAYKKHVFKPEQGLWIQGGGVGITKIALGANKNKIKNRI